METTLGRQLFAIAVTLAGALLLYSALEAVSESVVVEREGFPTALLPRDPAAAGSHAAFALAPRREGSRNTEGGAGSYPEHQTETDDRGRLLAKTALILLFARRGTGDALTVC